jgi:hypothetical protein
MTDGRIHRSHCSSGVKSNNSISCTTDAHATSRLRVPSDRSNLRSIAGEMQPHPATHVLMYSSRCKGFSIPSKICALKLSEKPRCRFPASCRPDAGFCQTQHGNSRRTCETRALRCRNVDLGASQREEQPFTLPHSGQRPIPTSHLTSQVHTMEELLERARSIYEGEIVCNLPPISCAALTAT